MNGQTNAVSDERVFETAGEETDERKNDMNRNEKENNWQIGDYFEEEDGVATVEIVLILLVLIALVVLFKGQITKILKNLMNKVSSQSNGV